MSDPTEVSHPIIKGLSAVGIWLTSLDWSKPAQAGAFLYTMILVFEWFWKKLWRPFLVQRGWITKDFKYLRDTNRDDTLK